MISASASTGEWTLAQLAEFVSGESRGNSAKKVTHAATLTDANSDSISYCASAAQAQGLKDTQAGIVILDKQTQTEYEGECIIVERPRLAFSHIVDLLHPPPAHETGIHPTAVIGKNCRIDSSASVGPNAVIGNDVELGVNVSIEAGTVLEDSAIIGKGSQIGANAAICRRTTIGSSCRISAGVVLGASGFSFEWDGARWVPIRNIGVLTIGDDVDIGACTTIDRASIGETQIHSGVRIDNHCHIGHNAVIGEHSLIVANVSIGGSARIGRQCVIGGHATIKDNVTIADGVTILGASVVTKSISLAGTYSSAVPARAANKWNRTLAKLNRLDS